MAVSRRPVSLICFLLAYVFRRGEYLSILLHSSSLSLRQMCVSTKFCVWSVLSMCALSINFSNCVGGSSFYRWPVEKGISGENRRKKNDSEERREKEKNKTGWLMGKRFCVVVALASPPPKPLPLFFFSINFFFLKSPFLFLLEYLPYDRPPGRACCFPANRRLQLLRSWHKVAIPSFRCYSPGDEWPAVQIDATKQKTNLDPKALV